MWGYVVTFDQNKRIDLLVHSFHIIKVNLWRLHWTADYKFTPNASGFDYYRRATIGIVKPNRKKYKLDREHSWCLAPWDILTSFQPIVFQVGNWPGLILFYAWLIKDFNIPRVQCKTRQNIIESARTLQAKGNETSPMGRTEKRLEQKQLDWAKLKSLYYWKFQFPVSSF